MLPSLQKEWKFAKYACSSGRRGGIKLQAVLLKTAYAAFVWTCKTQQLNASIVCRGKYANSKHISHQKPFQACHRWDMKDDKRGEQGEARALGARLRALCAAAALNGPDEPGHPWRPSSGGFPWAPPAPAPGTPPSARAGSWGAPGAATEGLLPRCASTGHHHPSCSPGTRGFSLGNTDHDFLFSSSAV